MIFKEYVSETAKTAIYPYMGEIKGLNYALTGYNGEVGEVFNVIQKCMRDDNWIVTDQKKEKFIGEFGGCMWFLARVLEENRQQMLLTGEIVTDPVIYDMSLEELWIKGSAALEIIKDSKEPVIFHVRQSMAVAQSDIIEAIDNLDFLIDDPSAFKKDAYLLDLHQDIENGVTQSLISLVASMNMIGITLEDVCKQNLALLDARKKAGTIGGSGDGVDGAERTVK